MTKPCMTMRDLIFGNYDLNPKPLNPNIWYSSIHWLFRIFDIHTMDGLGLSVVSGMSSMFEKRVQEHVCSKSPTLLFFKLSNNERIALFA